MIVYVATGDLLPDHTAKITSIIAIAHEFNSWRVRLQPKPYFIYPLVWQTINIYAILTTVTRIESFIPSEFYGRLNIQIAWWLII